MNVEGSALELGPHEPSSLSRMVGSTKSSAILEAVESNVEVSCSLLVFFFVARHGVLLGSSKTSKTRDYFCPLHSNLPPSLPSFNQNFAARPSTDEDSLPLCSVLLLFALVLLRCRHTMAAASEPLIVSHAPGEQRLRRKEKGKGRARDAPLDDVHMPVAGPSKQSRVAGPSWDCIPIARSEVSRIPPVWSKDGRWAERVSL